MMSTQTRRPSSSGTELGAVAVSFAPLWLSKIDWMRPDGAMINETAFIADLASISERVVAFSPTSGRSRLVVDKRLSISHYRIHPPEVPAVLRSSQMFLWSVLVLIQILHLSRGQRRIITIRGPLQAAVMSLPLRVFGSFVIYRGMSVPLVHREARLSGSNRLTQSLIWLCDVVALTTANLITVSSKRANDEVLRFTPWVRGRSIVVPFSRSLRLEDETPRRFSYDTTEASTVFVGYIGSFNALYSFTTLADSLELLNQDGNTNFKLVVAGEGPLKGDLLKTLERKGLLDHVVDLGVVPHDKIVQVYRQIRMLAIPLRSGVSGEPIKAYEALLSGTPVVLCTDSPYERFKNEQNCLIVRSEDSASLAQAIKRVCTDEALRDLLVKNGYRTVKEMEEEVDSFLKMLVNKLSEGA
jgi:glycosyltransferase involved in cell wall biosynthesis